jgi:uncharacterized membrane protein
MYKYPYSKKWVFFSCVIVALSVAFTLYVSHDPISMLLFISYTSIMAGIFYLLKLRIYVMKSQEELKSSVAEEEEPSARLLYFLVLVLIAALFVPFVLLLFLEPLSWFLSLTGFIAGINIPEIFLYLFSTES